MSNFRQKVFQIVKQIKPGKVLTYKQVACMMGNPKAVRAVARVLASNFDPGIACHRVICSNGKLGGYNRGGIAAKKKLLESEGVIL